MPRAIIVCPDIKSHAAQPYSMVHVRLPEARAEEAINLCSAIDLEIAQTLHFNVNKVRPATLIGSGQMQEVALLAKEEAVEVVVIDAEITPMQQRNLEVGTGCKVIDRPALILEIFGKRAKSREGRLQVELAALDYQKSRLVRSWTHLERQRGGFGFLGGPGESQIETDRRLIRERMAVIQKQLDKVVQTRGLHRRVRKDVPTPTVALIGYTNAGKSTLFNRLTRADVLAKDALFATLDPTIRRVRLPAGMEILLSDTVGFIANLPTQLIAAFRATLEEVRHADLLLHVRDITHPDTHAQKEDVMHVMREIFGEDTDAMPPIIELWNKCDKADSILAENLALYTQNPIAVSARTGYGMEATGHAIESHLMEYLYEVAEYHLPISAGDALAWLYRHGIVEQCISEEDMLHVQARLSPANIRRFATTFQQQPAYAQQALI